MLVEKIELDDNPKFKPIKIEVTIESLVELANLYQRLNTAVSTVTPSEFYEIPEPNDSDYALHYQLNEEIEHLVEIGIIKRK